MKQYLSGKNFLLFLWGGLLVGVDFVTKKWAQNLENSLEIFGHFFRLEFHQNSGIAFSLPVPSIVQIGLSFLFLFFLAVFWKKSESSFLRDCSFSLVFAGAIGNLHERIFGGLVTDFIAVWNFPIFNMADIAIFLGISGILLSEFLITKK